MKIIGFAGWSGSGKTTLIEKLVPLLKQRGLSVSLIKHAHHRFDVDTPGKDSHRHREAGALEVLVSSSRRWVLMHELRGAPEPDLDAQLARLSPCDMVLIEGYKHAPIAKIEVWRRATGEPLLHPNDRRFVAIASDMPLATGISRLDLNDAQAIAEYLIATPAFDAPGGAAGPAWAG